MMQGPPPPKMVSTAVMLLEFRRATGVAPAYPQPPQAHHCTRQTVLIFLLTLALPQIPCSARFAHGCAPQLLRRACPSPPVTLRPPHPPIAPSCPLRL